MNDLRRQQWVQSFYWISLDIGEVTSVALVWHRIFVPSRRPVGEEYRGSGIEL
jgi:hypothetical protein